MQVQSRWLPLTRTLETGLHMSSVVPAVHTNLSGSFVDTLAPRPSAMGKVRGSTKLG